MKIQKFSGKTLTFSPKNHLKSEPKYYRHFFLTLALLAINCVKNFQIRRSVWSLFFPHSNNKSPHSVGIQQKTVGHCPYSDIYRLRVLNFFRSFIISISQYFQYLNYSVSIYKFSSRNQACNN